MHRGTTTKATRQSSVVVGRIISTTTTSMRPKMGPEEVAFVMTTTILILGALLACSPVGASVETRAEANELRTARLLAGEPGAVLRAISANDLQEQPAPPQQAANFSPTNSNSNSNNNNVQLPVQQQAQPQTQPDLPPPPQQYQQQQQQQQQVQQQQAQPQAQQPAQHLDRRTQKLMSELAGLGMGGFINGNHAAYIEPPADFKPIIYDYLVRRPTDETQAPSPARDVSQLAAGQNGLAQEQPHHHHHHQHSQQQRQEQQQQQQQHHHNTYQQKPAENDAASWLDEDVSSAAPSAPFKPPVGRWSDWHDMSIEPDLASSEAGSSGAAVAPAAYILMPGRPQYQFGGGAAPSPPPLPGAVGGREVAAAAANWPLLVVPPAPFQLSYKRHWPALERRAREKKAARQLGAGLPDTARPLSNQVAVRSAQPLEPVTEIRAAALEHQPQPATGGHSSAAKSDPNWSVAAPSQPSQSQSQSPSQQQQQHQQQSERIKSRRRRKSKTNAEVRIQQLVAASQEQELLRSKLAAAGIKVNATAAAAAAAGDAQYQPAGKLLLEHWSSRAVHQQQQQQQQHQQAPDQLATDYQANHRPAAADGAPLQPQPAHQQSRVSAGQARQLSQPPATVVLARRSGSAPSPPANSQPPSSPQSGAALAGRPRAIKRRRIRTQLPVGLTSWLLGGIRDLDARHWQLPSDVITRLAVNDVDFHPNGPPKMQPPAAGSVVLVGVQEAAPASTAEPSTAAPPVALAPSRPQGTIPRAA